MPEPENNAAPGPENNAAPEPEDNAAPGPEDNADQADAVQESKEGTESLGPEMLSPEVRETAAQFFERAEQATVRGNYDYAINLYLQGIRLNPFEIEKGHRGLRDAALKRQGQGKGFGLGSIFGQAKAALSTMLGRKKDAMLSLLSAVAKDPNNIMLMSQVMQTARRLRYTEVAVWYGELAAEASLRGKKKPQKQIFTTLADLYEAQARFRDAIDSLQHAVQIDPADRTLDKRMRDMAAAASIHEGQLESVTGARDMIRDKAQATESERQQVVRTKEQLDEQYAALKASLDDDPDNPVKMQTLAECQWRRGNIDEAMALLKKALSQSGEYRYKSRMDDIRMAEFRRELRQIERQLKAEADRTDLKEKRKELSERQNALEYEIYIERQKQYPTDMSIRYELGLREYRTGRYDDAIVSFQQATRDPKRRIQAYNMLGRCFFSKKLYQEAQGQFETAIKQYELSGDPMGKELRYNLARTLETQQKYREAIDWYSDIVQQDYQYLDAAKRLEALRDKGSEQS